MSARDFADCVTDPAASERLVVDAGGLLVADGSDAEIEAHDVAHLPVVIAALGDGWPPWADLVLGPGEDTARSMLVETVSNAPMAAACLALLLRSSERMGTASGLVTESMAYSMLQGGPEFGSWLGGRERMDRTFAGADAPVLLDRSDDTLLITLDNPDRHNAISPGFRDELSAALHLALVDTSIVRVVIRGNGPSFCSGGDLATFGDFESIVGAHLTRLTRSPASLLARLADRVTAHIHGSTLGGGIELAAFAGLVVADPQTRIGLPEVRFGLIPGAGGTVSVPRRIGRHLTARLALAETTIDAPTALQWGLVDEISSR